MTALDFLHESLAALVAEHRDDAAKTIAAGAQGNDLDRVIAAIIAGAHVRAARAYEGALADLDAALARGNEAVDELVEAGEKSAPGLRLVRE